MENKESRISINIVEVLKDFLQKWWIILIASVIGASALIVYTFFTTEKQYAATAKMYVHNKSAISDAIESITNSDLSTSRSLVNTYKEILNTHLVLEDVLKTSGLEDKYTYSQIKNMVTVGALNNTEVLYIKVTCKDEQDAKLLANTTVRVFKEQIGSIVGSALIIDYAVDATPVSRGFTKKGLIGFAVGFVLALAGIFLFDFYINDTLQTTDSLKQCLPDDIPVLSIIPDTDTSTAGGKYGYYKKYGHYANSYSYSYYQETVGQDENAEKENE